ncbi:hypothetical protein OROMI_031531 [Orobanche minor]
MEENFRPEDPHPTPLKSPANIGCSRELTRSNSDALSLTAENCKDILRRSLNVSPMHFCGMERRINLSSLETHPEIDAICNEDDGTAWTNEKHNLYLHQLEVSFVKKLHQSKSLLAHSSVKIQSGTIMSPKRLANATNASEENGCWQIYCLRGEGSGQNFLDEDDKSTSNFESQAKVVEDDFS